MPHLSDESVALYVANALKIGRLAEETLRVQRFMQLATRQGSDTAITELSKLFRALLAVKAASEDIALCARH